MPFEFNNTLVVRYEELVPTFFPSYDALAKRIQRYEKKDYGIKAVQRGGNGRELLISFDSLDKDVRDAIGDPRKAKHLLENWYKTDDNAVKFFTKFEFDDGDGLSLKHIEEYITNASVLSACVELKKAREYERKTKNHSLKGVMHTICQDAHGFQTVLKVKYDIQHTLPESDRRFKEAFRAFTNSTDGGYNYDSLISGKLRNQNSKKVTDEVLDLLNNLFSDNKGKPTRTEISNRFEAFLSGYMEVINPETGELFDPKQFQPLSDATIINYLGKWEDYIATSLKRSGNRQIYMGKFNPHHSLIKPQFAGSIISVDDRQPPFKYAGNDRAWFYMGIDLGSEAFTCWVHGKSKEGIIIEFYRQMVRNYTEWGICLPAELEAEASLNSAFQNTFLRNGALFNNVRIEANNARGKRIERYWSTLRYQFEKDKEGWLARPHAKKEDNQGGPSDVPVIPYTQIVENSLRDIEDWNNMPHSDYPDKTRWEVFMEMQHPDLQPTNWKAILPFLGFRTETSCNAGIIRFQNKEFLLGHDGKVSTGETLIKSMKLVEGQKVDVYWLDDNNGNVLKALVYLRGGDKYICEAVAKPMYSRAKIERTSDQEKAREVMSAYANTISSYARRRMSQLQDLVIIDHREKTLNRKFVIKDLDKRKRPVDTETEEVETLPDLPDEMEAQVNHKSKSLKDRF